MSSGPEGRRTASEAHERRAGDYSSETEKIKNGQGFLNSFCGTRVSVFFQTSKI
jgi:hypothetical protein